MVSKRDKIYFSTVVLFGGLAALFLVLFILSRNFVCVIPAEIFVGLMYIVILIGLLDRKR